MLLTFQEHVLNEKEMSHFLFLKVCNFIIFDQLIQSLAENEIKVLTPLSHLSVKY